MALCWVRVRVHGSVLGLGYIAVLGLGYMALC